jgi:hypothetical protein
VQLVEARQKESWFAMDACKAIRDMTIAEKTHLESFFTSLTCTADSVLWRSGEPAQTCVLIVEGEFTISVGRSLTDGRREEVVGMLHRGAFVGDINAIMSCGQSQTTLKCSMDGLVLAITQVNLVKFFKLYPGALVNFKDQHWVL